MSIGSDAQAFLHRSWAHCGTFTSLSAGFRRSSRSLCRSRSTRSWIVKQVCLSRSCCQLQRQSDGLLQRLTLPVFHGRRRCSIEDIAAGAGEPAFESGLVHGCTGEAVRVPNHGCCSEQTRGLIRLDSGYQLGDTLQSLREDELLTSLTPDCQRSREMPGCTLPVATVQRTPGRLEVSACQA